MKIKMFDHQTLTYILIIKNFTYIMIIKYWEYIMISCINIHFEYNTFINHYD